MENDYVREEMGSCTRVGLSEVEGKRNVPESRRKGQEAPASCVRRGPCCGRVPRVDTRV